MANITTRPKNKLQGTATGFQKGKSTGDYPQVNSDQLINDKADTYSQLLTAAMKMSGNPLEVKGSTYLYQPDYNWGKWTNTNYSAWMPNDTRLGYLNKSHDFNPTGKNSYSAGIDNLYGLGEDYISKEYDLPLGVKASVEYDGDGTLSGNLDIPQKQYYLAALANLLRGR